MLVYQRVFISILLNYVKLIPIYNGKNMHRLYTINKLEWIHKLENRREYGGTLEDHVNFYGDNLTEFEWSNPLPTSFRLLNDPNRCVCNRGSEVAVYNVYTPNLWPLLAVLIGNRADETFHLGHSMVIPCYTFFFSNRTYWKSGCQVFFLPSEFSEGLVFFSWTMMTSSPIITELMALDHLAVAVFQSKLKDFRCVFSCFFPIHLD